MLGGGGTLNTARPVPGLNILCFTEFHINQSFSSRAASFLEDKMLMKAKIPEPEKTGSSSGEEEAEGVL